MNRIVRERTNLEMRDLLTVHNIETLIDSIEGTAENGQAEPSTMRNVLDIIKDIKLFERYTLQKVFPGVKECRGSATAMLTVDQK